MSRLSNRDRAVLVHFCTEIPETRNEQAIKALGVPSPYTAHLIEKGLLETQGFEVITCDAPSNDEVLAFLRADVVNPTPRGLRAVRHWRQMRSRASWFAS